MARAVRFRVSDGVAAVTLNNPPLNIVTHAMRSRLQTVFAKIEGNASVRAVVLLADGADFCAGADIKEYQAGAQSPTLGDICDMIENCKCPVVVGLQGRVLGGGLELALAAHMRVATQDVTMGLPEVDLGLLPGAGGTQRLPRIVGAKLALDMAVDGAVIGSDEAKASGLITGHIEGDVASGAIVTARKLIEDETPPVKTRMLRGGFDNMAGYTAAVTQAKTAATAPQDFAKRKIIDCIEAAPLLPFDAGQTFEQTAFEDCRTSHYSKALRHVFFAERAVAKSNAGLGAMAIAERVSAAYFLAADTLVRKGVPVPSVDGAMRSFGFKYGPLRMMDHIGLQKVLIARKRHFPDALLSVAADLVNKGAEGQMSGDGFYIYEAKLAVNPEVAETVSQVGDGREVRLAPVTIQRLCIGAMAAMGERLVQSGDVPSPQYIDIAMIQEEGYPRYQGGPMTSADLIGLLPLKTFLAKISGPDYLWSTGALWDEALKTADGFGAFNRGSG